MAVAPRSNAAHDQNFVPTLIGVSTVDGLTPVAVEVDPTTGQLQVSSTGGGGGGGAATIADGADVTQGAIADSAYTSGNGTVVSILKGIFTKLAGTLTVDTELPAAATLADSTANPTVPGVGGFNEVYATTAATWGRQRSIEHGQNTTGGGVTAAGLLAEFDDVTPTAVTENQFAPVRMSSRREVYTTLRDAAGNERGVNVTSGNALTVDGSASTQPVSGTVATTQSGTWTVQPGNTANTTAWLVDETGRSVSSQTALTTTATVSGSAGRFSGGSFMNLNSVPSYIQVFDTTGAVTLGTTVPTLVQPIPTNATAANGAAYVFNIHPGVTMANGIKAAATTTATGASTSATALIGYFLYR